LVVDSDVISFRCSNSLNVVVVVVVIGNGSYWRRCGRRGFCGNRLTSKELVWFVILNYNLVDEIRFDLYNNKNKGMFSSHTNERKRINDMSVKRERRHA
jgi:hypothetical protein